jgi:hypothetical protein
MKSEHDSRTRKDSLKPCRARKKPFKNGGTIKIDLQTVKAWP